MQGQHGLQRTRVAAAADALILDPQSSKHTFSHRRTSAGLSAYSLAGRQILPPGENAA